MIDNDIEKADGELRAMLASMVNEPLLDAMRRNNQAMTEHFLEELRSESLTTIRQVEKRLAGIRDEIDEVRSKVGQIQADGVASRGEIGQRLSDIGTSVDAAGGALGHLPAQVQDALMGDFADGGRRLNDAVVVMKAAMAATEQSSRLAIQELASRLAAAEMQYVSDRDEWMRVFRSLRILVVAVGAIATCGVVGTVTMLIRTLAH